MATTLETPVPPTYSIEGLGSFDGAVLFAEVKRNRQLVVDIGNAVRSTFEGNGIYNSDDYPVNPHATILKMFQARRLKDIGIRWLKSQW